MDKELVISEKLITGISSKLRHSLEPLRRIIALERNRCDQTMMRLEKIPLPNLISRYNDIKPNEHYLEYVKSVAGSRGKQNIVKVEVIDKYLDPVPNFCNAIALYLEGRLYESTDTKSRCNVRVAIDDMSNRTIMDYALHSRSIREISLMTIREDVERNMFLLFPRTSEETKALMVPMVVELEYSNILLEANDLMARADDMLSSLDSPSSLMPDSLEPITVRGLEVAADLLILLKKAVYLINEIVKFTNEFGDIHELTNATD